MRTLAGSELAIGFYPKFVYDSSGGGGIATASSTTASRVNLDFDPSTIVIPDVTGRSSKLTNHAPTAYDHFVALQLLAGGIAVWHFAATFLGVPMLPYLRIAIQPTRLQGYVDRDTGEIELSFDAEFSFNAGSLYKAPPLFVKTQLSSEQVASRHHRRQGVRMNRDGYAVLTGVAEIAPTGDLFMDNFLQLPTDVLAVMKSQFVFPVQSSLA